MSLDHLLLEIRQKLLSGQKEDEELEAQCEKLLQNHKEASEELLQLHTELCRQDEELSVKFGLAKKECEQIKSIIKSISGGAIL
jgi:predicted nuclease with TOPRIM domain